jgi:hypothetical protein
MLDEKQPTPRKRHDVRSITSANISALIMDRCYHKPARRLFEGFEAHLTLVYRYAVIALSHNRSNRCRSKLLSA